MLHHDWQILIKATILQEQHLTALHSVTWRTEQDTSWLSEVGHAIVFLPKCPAFRIKWSRLMRFYINIKTISSRISWCRPKVNEQSFKLELHGIWHRSAGWFGISSIQNRSAVSMEMRWMSERVEWKSDSLHHHPLIGVKTVESWPANTIAASIFSRSFSLWQCPAANLLISSWWQSR